MAGCGCTFAAKFGQDKGWVEPGQIAVTAGVAAMAVADAGHAATITVKPLDVRLPPVLTAGDVELEMTTRKTPTALFHRSRPFKNNGGNARAAVGRSGAWSGPED